MTYEEEQRLKKLKDQERWLNKIGIEKQKPVNAKPIRTVPNVKFDITTMVKSHIIHENTSYAPSPYSTKEEQKIKKEEKEQTSSDIGSIIGGILIMIVFPAIVFALGILQNVAIVLFVIAIIVFSLVSLFRK